MNTIVKGGNIQRYSDIDELAQARLRHSDPKLTMNVYTKLGLGDQAAALQALPKISTG